MSGSTITTLKTVVFDECGLHGMQVSRLSEALDGGDLVTVVHHSQRQARIDPASIHHHGTSAALSVIAAFLCAG